MSEIEILRQEIRELKTISLMSQKDVLDMEEASIFTSLSYQTLYKMCQQKTIPYYKSKGGKKTYFRKSELTDWMLHKKVMTEDLIQAEASKKAYLRN